jgi:multidrug efflux pump subunit AcrA (membrane-fusion protein)
MREDYENIEIRSEEVQEILGTPPNWLTRWGTIVAMVAVLALGWTGYWIKYPDVVEAQIKVSTVDPPAKLAAKNTAFLAHLLVEEGDTVDRGQLLAVFSTQADYIDVMALSDQLMVVNGESDSSLLAFRPHKDLLLGELQPYLDDFISTQETFRMLRSGSMERLSSRQKRGRIALLEAEIDGYEEAKETIDSQIELDEKLFQNDKKRYERGEISIDALRRQQNTILALKRERASAESAIKSRQYELDLLNSQLSSLRRDTEIGRETASEDLKASFRQLKNQVQEWERNFMLISPIRGQVVFTDQDLQEQGFVDLGTELMMVLPIGPQDVAGRISLKLKGSGKVKEGQRVVVKFDSYPFHEFGAVTGRVVDKGPVPINGTIPVEVAFPQGLRTTKNRTIDVAQEMTGTAEIITEDKRLIERIFLSFQRMAS